MVAPEAADNYSESWEQNLLIVAPPGCGKTELLAKRADRLIPRLLPNQKILALTFTNRAKANLSDRLRQILGAQRFRRYVRVHNFHGHATEIILAHGRTIGMELDDLHLPSTQTLRKALQQFSSDTETNRAAEALLGSAKRNCLDDAEVMNALKRAGDALAVRVERERVSDNQLHYDDLLRHAQRLLRVDEVACLYQQHYGAVLVDEFQDLSLQQLDVVLRTCTSSRTFAGDPLQGIYSWAGASPKEIEAQLIALCGKPVQLTTSYRSSPAVLALLNSVAMPMGAVALKAHDPQQWFEGGASAVVELRSPQHEAEVISLIAQRIVKVDPNTSVGVISRAGWRRSEIDKVFAELPDVPCRRWDLAIDDPLILERVRVAVAGLPPAATVDDARNLVVHSLESSDVDTLEEVTAVFDQLQLVEASEGGSIRSILRRFPARGDESAVGPGVHLLNAHTGKGQQFDWVFVIGLEEGHLPGSRSNTGEALKEEERVLLVMLSRARHGIMVSRAKKLNGKFGPYDSKPSRWLQQLQTAATMNGPTLWDHVKKKYPLP